MNANPTEVPGSPIRHCKVLSRTMRQEEELDYMVSIFDQVMTELDEKLSNE